ncbi:SH3 domain-containing protein (plasmid) [Sorangium sp. So ce119]|uniref:SH3 domain-containing protein n=1 Tax=Sorangium sp. So ce119 TaxID=3133279 RepID=UPI003F63298A
MDDSSAAQGASPGRVDAGGASTRHAGARPAALAEPPPGDAPAAPPARRLDRLTGLVLLAATAIALFPTAPLLLRALAGERPPMQGAGRFAHLLERRSPDEEASRAHPRFPFDDDDPGAHDPRTPHDDPPGFDEEVDEPGAPSRLQLGIASRGVTLVDEPRPDGARVGAIAAGELVMVVRESGGWVLVVKNQGGSMMMGWARRSEIAVR